MPLFADKYAIGTEHVIDGITVIVEEASAPNLCKGCAFNYNMGTIPCCLLPKELKDIHFTHSGICYDTERSDGKNVIFRRKEQQ